MQIGIFGTGRNGSTLLLRLLDGIPNTYVHPIETNFLSAMNDLAAFGFVTNSIQKNATQKPLKRLYAPIHTYVLKRYYGPQESEMQQIYLSQMDPPLKLGEPPFSSVKQKSHYLAQEFVLDFLNSMAAWITREIPSHTVFKTIETPYIDDYERLFPEMKFIHIIRNPLEMWSSAKRTLMCVKTCPSWYLGGDNLRTMIDIRWMSHAEAILARKSDPRHYVVFYEDIIKDAKNTVEKICRWLGVSAPPEPTKLTVLGGKSPKVLHHNVSMKNAETPREVQQDLRKKYSYPEAATEREKAYILLRTFELGQKLGYFESEKKPSPEEVRCQWLKTDEWDFKHARGPVSLARSMYCFLSKRRRILTD